MIHRLEYEVSEALALKQRLQHADDIGAKIMETIVSEALALKQRLQPREFFISCA